MDHAHAADRPHRRTNHHRRRHYHQQQFIHHPIDENDHGNNGPVHGPGRPSQMHGEQSNRSYIPMTSSPLRPNSTWQRPEMYLNCTYTHYHHHTRKNHPRDFLTHPRHQTLTDNTHPRPTKTATPTYSTPTQTRPASSRRSASAWSTTRRYRTGTASGRNAPMTGIVRMRPSPYLISA